MSSLLLIFSIFVAKSQINCPDKVSSCGPCTGLSGANDQCILNCSGQDDCAGDTITCTDDFKCVLTCDGYDSCMNAVLNAETATSLTVNCGEENEFGLVADCWNLHINAQSVTNVAVNCFGNGRSCEQMTLNCGTGTCQIICHSGNCANVVIDASLSSQYICVGDGCNNVRLTSANPTTMNPTTRIPTTTNPTTRQPTTANPTSGEPTTNNPTTFVPTTFTPTTHSPTISPTTVNDVQVTESPQATTVIGKLINDTKNDSWVVYLLTTLALVSVAVICCIVVYKIKSKRKMVAHVMETVNTGEINVMQARDNQHELIKEDTQIISETPMNKCDINMSEDEFIIEDDIVSTPDQNFESVDKGTGSVDHDDVIIGDDEVYATKGANNMHHLEEGATGADDDDSILNDVNAINQKTIK
eukprot:138560_1